MLANWKPARGTAYQDIPKGVVCGIYAATHLPTGRHYFGSSNNIRRRLRTHLYTLRHGTHQNPHLQSAWKKYGEAAFRFSVVELVGDESQLLEREQAHLAANIDGFNLCVVAGKPPNGNRRGIPLSEETKKKLSAANLGKKLSSETCQKMSEYRRGRKHGPMSAEQRLKLSRAHTGKVYGSRHPDVGRRISAAKTGKPMPESWRIEMIARLTGRKLSKEHCENIRLGHRARKERRMLLLGTCFGD